MVNFVFAILFVIGAIVAFRIASGAQNKLNKAVELKAAGQRVTFSESSMRMMKKGFSTGAKSALVVALVFLIFSFLITIPAGHVGVVTVFGEVQPNVLQPGLHAIAPWADAHRMESRILVVEKAMNASSESGVTFDLVVKVTFQLDEAMAVETYEMCGHDWYNRLVEPLINDSMKDVCVNYGAEAMYTSSRPLVTQECQDLMIERSAGTGVIVREVYMENMDLPTGLRGAVESKMEAEQAALEMEYILQQEVLEADRKVVEATGLANAQEIINSTLTPEYLQFFALQTYAGLIGSENTTFVLAIGENGMPMILNPDR